MLAGGLDRFPEAFMWHVQMIILCIIFNARNSQNDAKIILLKVTFVVNAFILCNLRTANVLYMAMVLEHLFLLFAVLGWACDYSGNKNAQPSPDSDASPVESDAHAVHAECSLPPLLVDETSPKNDTQE